MTNMNIKMTNAVKIGPGFSHISFLNMPVTIPYLDHCPGDALLALPSGGEGGHEGLGHVVHRPPPLLHGLLQQPHSLGRDLGAFLDCLKEGFPS